MNRVAVDVFDVYLAIAERYDNAVNWLLDRPVLLNGIGPSPVTDFRLLMTKAQVRNVRWLLLAALPAAILALGGLVWLRRRK